MAHVEVTKIMKEFKEIGVEQFEKELDTQAKLFQRQKRNKTLISTKDDLSPAEKIVETLFGPDPQELISQIEVAVTYEGPVPQEYPTQMDGVDKLNPDEDAQSFQDSFSDISEAAATTDASFLDACADEKNVQVQDFQDESPQKPSININIGLIIVTHDLNFHFSRGMSLIQDGHHHSFQLSLFSKCKYL